jgi:hypothetical protein
MAATKTKRTIIAAATSNSAGGTTNGTELDLSTKYGAIVTCRITNGATGPTIAADFVVYVGSATGEKREFSRQTSATGNNTVTDFAVEIPPGVMFVNVDITGNTAQAVTAEVFAQELTTI